MFRTRREIHRHWALAVVTACLALFVGSCVNTGEPTATSASTTTSAAPPAATTTSTASTITTTTTIPDWACAAYYDDLFEVLQLLILSANGIQVSISAFLNGDFPASGLERSLNLQSASLDEAYTFLKEAGTPPPQFADAIPLLELALDQYNLGATWAAAAAFTDNLSAIDEAVKLMENADELIAEAIVIISPCP